MRRAARSLVQLSPLLLLSSLAGCGAQAPSAVDGAPSSVPFEVREATIAGIQEAIRGGRTTCRDVVRGYLDRIDAFDESTGLHAITVVNPRALERAAEIDDRIRSGAPVGRLFCAPILVKDNFDTHDLETTAGSEVLLAHLPPDDAFMVRRIREEDGIVVAKTNMAEWAFSPKRTESSSYGVTANAYALDRVPAGSSGGTASGVASSLGVAGLGSDTGNSIRGPSSHLALFGIRSTIGLTSRDGVVPLFFDRDIAGPMTRTVADGALLFDVVAGFDPADPYTEAAKAHREADYTAFLEPGGLVGLRVGVFRALASAEDSDPRILSLFEAALEALRSAGATVVDPFLFPEYESFDWEAGFCSRFRHDMGVYLASRGPDAPVRDVLEVWESGRFSEYTREVFAFHMESPREPHPSHWEPPCPDYFDHPVRQTDLRATVAAMDREAVDVLVFPTWSYPPAPLTRAEEEYRGDNSQGLVPHTGLPAVTIPMGFVDGTLPAGLQLVGRPWSEGLLIRAAYGFEQATQHRQPPPGFPPLERTAAD